MTIRDGDDDGVFQTAASPLGSPLTLPAGWSRVIRVETTAEVEALRRIRNSCREYMTRDQSWISVARQRRWWATHDRENTQIFLYVAEGADTPGGYGLLRNVGGEVWLSGGLRDDLRGVGLGRALFADLSERAAGSCFLEVLRNNTRAQKAYGSLGFKVIARTPEVVVMRLDKK